MLESILLQFAAFENPLQIFERKDSLLLQKHIDEIGKNRYAINNNI